MLNTSQYLRKKLSKVPFTFLWYVSPHQLQRIKDSSLRNDHLGNRLLWFFPRQGRGINVALSFLKRALRIL